MTTPLCYGFEYCFHGVGQGLFASGAIYSCRKGTLKYQWVYDCGSSTSQALLQQRVAELKARQPQGDRLHLVTLSHFDRDHISGICDLLRSFKVLDLLLPYMPLWKRLLIAFQERITPDEDLFRFFINPVEYLADLDGSDIRRVIFVGGSGEDGPPAPDVPPRRNEPPQDDNDRHWIPQFPTQEPEDEGDAAMLRTSGVRVDFLRRGGALTLASVWEFVPFNDDSQSPAPPGWESAVAGLRNALIKRQEDDSRRAALDDLKYTYDKRFTTACEHCHRLNVGRRAQFAKLFSERIEPKSASPSRTNLLSISDAFAEQVSDLWRICEPRHRFAGIFY